MIAIFIDHLFELHTLVIENCMYSKYNIYKQIYISLIIHKLF